MTKERKKTRRKSRRKSEIKINVKNEWKVVIDKRKKKIGFIDLIFTVYQLFFCGGGVF